ncbi:unnamed protein product [Linum tenue]|uniref:Uncharacterized protein n=1 Tax=Linum tenue TaxID=586396 RepID=A0AAV0JVR7_9ROSI|nr:unnamed protein product [Linum tenue]
MWIDRPKEAGQLQHPTVHAVAVGSGSGGPQRGIRLAVSKVSWDSYADGGELNGRSREVRRDGGYNVANCMRAVAEPLLVSQFGPGEVIDDEVFRWYRAIVTERMAKEKTEFVNVIVSLTKSRRC